MIGRLKLVLEKTLISLLSKVQGSTNKDDELISLSKEERLKDINEFQVFIMREINYQKTLYYHNTLNREKFEIWCEFEKFIFDCLQTHKDNIH